MQIELIGQPSGSAARVTLGPNEGLTAEIGAMIAMSYGLNVETTSRSRGGSGGILKGIKRMFSGENFFLNHFTATTGGQEVLVGPKLIGDIVHHRMAGGTLVVQGSSWLASSDTIDIDTTFQGLVTGLFAGEGLFWVKLTGEGDVLLNSFGAIYEVDVDGGYTVDTGHVVAFEDTLELNVGKAGSSLIGSFLSGEGLVSKFSGKGRLWCQTHNPPNFGKTLGPKLKPRQQ